MKGYDAIATSAKVKALKKVLFPHEGFPTSPSSIATPNLAAVYKTFCLQDSIASGFIEKFMFLQVRRKSGCARLRSRPLPTCALLRKALSTPEGPTPASLTTEPWCGGRGTPKSTAVDWAQSQQRLGGRRPSPIRGGRRFCRSKTVAPA